MVIQEMTRTECLHALDTTHLLRLACAHDNQPYIVPTYLAYCAHADEAPCLYGFTTPGQKLEWMRANPLVCVEVDAVESYDQWVSVIALGRFEELSHPSVTESERLPTQANFSQATNTPDYPSGPDDEMYLAHQVLQAKGLWWEPGSSVWAERKNRGSSDPFNPIYYKVRIEKLTGHKSVRETQDEITSNLQPSPSRRPGWLRNVLKKICGNRPRWLSYREHGSNV